MLKVNRVLVGCRVLLLINNVFLVVMAITVLLGTLYPLLIDALGSGKLSVGPPYFNALFVPIMSLLALSMGISGAARWRQTSIAGLKKQLFVPAIISLVVGLVFPFIYGDGFNFRVFLGITISTWIIATTAKEFKDKFRNTNSITAKLSQLTLSYYGMMLAHLGVAVVAIGITLVSTYSEERDMRMAPGDKIELADYQFEFKGAKKVKGANFTADEGTIVITLEGEPVVTLYPQKRHYTVKRSMMTEASIDPGLFRDLYLAMGEPLGNDGAWAIRVHYKPYVRWLWLGGLLMALGGLLTVFDKRYRSKSSSEVAHA
jgi:cytochrome c-type biogenesis protein CcmF